MSFIFDACTWLYKSKTILPVPCMNVSGKVFEVEIGKERESPLPQVGLINPDISRNDNSRGKKWGAIIKQDIMMEIDYAIMNHLLPAFCPHLTPVHSPLGCIAAWNTVKWHNPSRQIDLVGVTSTTHSHLTPWPNTRNRSCQCSDGGLCWA